MKTSTNRIRNEEKCNQLEKEEEEEEEKEREIFLRLLLRKKEKI